MSLDSQSGSDSIIPLSQGLAKRRLSQAGVEHPIVVNPTELEEILSRVVNKLEDAALRVTTDMGATDLAIAGISLPHDDYYIYTTGMLSNKLGLVSKKSSSKNVNQKIRPKRESGLPSTNYDWNQYEELRS